MHVSIYNLVNLEQHVSHKSILHLLPKIYLFRLYFAIETRSISKFIRNGKKHENVLNDWTKGENAFNVLSLMLIEIS